MGAHSAAQIAKWFLAYNRNEQDNGADSISNMKLQKLLYYAQGSFLAVTGQPLFDDPIEAWKHGPVVESVYHQYKENGGNGITFEDPFDFSSFTDEEEELLEEVYNVFGQYSAWKLRDMTHAEAPWKETEQGHVISQDKIKAYFQKEYLVQ